MTGERMRQRAQATAAWLARRNSISTVTLIVNRVAFSGLPRASCSPGTAAHCSNLFSRWQARASLSWEPLVAAELAGFASMDNPLGAHAQERQHADYHLLAKLRAAVRSPRCTRDVQARSERARPSARFVLLAKWRARLCDHMKKFPLASGWYSTASTRSGCSAP